MIITNLNIQQLVDVVKQLSPDEKFILNEAIWSEGMDPEALKDIEADRLVQ